MEYLSGGNLDGFFYMLFLARQLRILCTWTTTIFVCCCSSGLPHDFLDGTYALHLPHYHCCRLFEGLSTFENQEIHAVVVLLVAKRVPGCEWRRSITSSWTITVTSGRKVHIAHSWVLDWVGVHKLWSRQISDGFPTQMHKVQKFKGLACMRNILNNALATKWWLQAPAGRGKPIAS